MKHLIAAQAGFNLQRVLVGLHFPVVKDVKVARLLIDEVDTNASVVASRPHDFEVRQRWIGQPSWYCDGLQEKVQ